MKALFITVDAPQLGRREKDMRNKATAAADSEQSRRINQNKKADTMASLQRRASVKQAKAAADAEQARRSTETAN